MSSPQPEQESKISSTGTFPTTHWSVVISAGQNTSPQATEALEVLCRTYWYPLYVHVRRRGYDPQEAQDLTQEFFLRLLTNAYLSHAERNKGKFRSYLLVALNHFLTDDWRRAQAAKRGGGQKLISLDADTAEARYTLEPSSDLTPERIYERCWALTLLDQAMVKLKEECSAAGKRPQFDVLGAFLTSEATESDRATAGAQLGMTPGAGAVAIHRLRQRYRELVLEAVAQVVASPAEVEDEIRWLFSVAA
ncbi:MAG: ECF-type sigma factor [Verrucomicrobia bacterium]|nr:ECF-type sigma factor [Verrucomicrobiota bacterium]